MFLVFLSSSSMMMSLEDCTGQMDEELSSKVGGVRIGILGLGG